MIPSKPSRTSDTGEEDLSDEELVERARAGDEDAVRLLHERYQGLLRSRVRRKLPRRMIRKAGISDVIQEAWVAALRYLPDFTDEGKGSFRRWLTTIVDSRVTDVIRQFVVAKKRSVDREITRTGRPETGAFVGKQPSPSAHAIEGETKEQIDREIEELSTDQARLLRLVHREGKSLAEAAEIMGRSREAIRKLYGRAVTALSARIEAEEEEGGR